MSFLTCLEVPYKFKWLGGGWVVQLITFSLPTRVEVELGCDNIWTDYPYQSSPKVWALVWVGNWEVPTICHMFFPRLEESFLSSRKTKTVWWLMWIHIQWPPSSWLRWGQILGSVQLFVSIRGSQCIWRQALVAARWRHIVVHNHHISSLDLKDVPLDDHLLELSFLHELGGCYPGVPWESRWCPTGIGCAQTVEWWWRPRSCSWGDSIFSTSPAISLDSTNFH